jgi:hypothetical protein
LVDRARDLVAEIEGRMREQAAVVEGRDGGGREADRRRSGGHGDLAAVAPKLFSFEQFDTTAVADLLTRRQHGVARAALNVLADQAADEANSILDAEGELDQRRADLDALARRLTAEGRRLTAATASVPGATRARSIPGIPS